MARSQAPLSLEYILLGFLYYGPDHGYELYKKITYLEGISLVWHIKQPKLYALLEKLEEDGLLISKMVPGEAHLMRKEFQISHDGKQSFLLWVSSPVRHGRDMRQEFLAKLFFAQRMDLEACMMLIEKQKLLCLEWLSELRSNFDKAGDHQRYERMIYQYRISQTQAMIEWLEFCRSDMKVDPALSPAGDVSI